MVQRRAVGERDGHGVSPSPSRVSRSACRAGRPWLMRWCSAKAALKRRRLESRPGHLRNRHGAVGQQLLGQQQAARLQVLHGRDALLGREDAAQVAVADAQARRQRRQRGGPPLAACVFNSCAARRASVREASITLHGRPAPGRSRAAFQARPKRGCLWPAPASRRSGSCGWACARGRSAGNTRRCS